jgi:hypothetical protein
LRSDTNRTIALLRHRRVVDDQHRIFAADQAIGLNEQFRLQWRRIPEAISDEMVQLVILARCQPRRHWLDALAIARSNQSRDIKRTQAGIWREGNDQPDVVCPVDVGAKYRVAEDIKIGPRFRIYEPFGSSVFKTKEAIPEALIEEEAPAR